MFKIKYRTFNVTDALKNNKSFNSQFTIIKTIYEKMKRAVHVVQDNKTGSKYTLKVRSDGSICRQKEIFDLLQKYGDSEYIVKFIDFVEIKEMGYYYYLYEYVDGVDLATYVKLNNLDEKDIMEIFYQLVLSVKFLHDLNVIHCDVKLENFIIDRNKKIVITDFDLSQISSEGEFMTDCISGTPGYMAPESYDLCIYSRKSDVWSIGIILYTLITKKNPRIIVSLPGLSEMCRRNEFKHIEFDEVEKVINQNNYSSSLLTLLKRMLEFEDYKRISIDEILNYEKNEDQNV